MNTQVANDIVPKLMELRPGDKLIYFTGFLARAREKDPEIRLIAESAWARYAVGRAALVQRRLAVDVYEYIEVGLENPRLASLIKAGVA